MIATWRKSLPSNIVVSINDQACQLPAQNFMTNTGFREIIETGHERPRARGRAGKIPLQPITNRLTKEATVAEITEIFDEYTGQVEDTNPFKTMLSELTENVLVHSDAVSPGYACARVLGSEDARAEICICDSGIGIKESFLSGTNELAIERIQRGANPLEIAVEGLNSSKPRGRTGSGSTEYYGFGLLITRMLVQENRGQMVIISGDQELHINRYDMQPRTLAHKFPGTFIGIVLDLANPLPLEQVYQEAINKLVPANGTSVTPVPPSIDQNSTYTQRSDGNSIAHGPRIEIRHYGTELLTRETGVIIRADLATKLAISDKIIVSLDQISDITPSVADEAFGKLAEGIGFDEFSNRILLEGGTPLIRRLIELVVKTRNSRAK